MGAFRRVYGSHPGHLLAMLFAFALGAYGLTRFFQEDHAYLRQALWLIGALLVNDFLLLPLYLALYRVARRLTGADERPRRRIPVLNHLLVPALISSFLFVAWLPLVLRLGIYQAITTLSPAPFLGRWAAITGGLFALSGLLYGLRALRAGSLPEADVPTPAPGGGPPP